MATLGVWMLALNQHQPVHDGRREWRRCPHSAIGRSQRGRYSLLLYALVVYGASALWLVPVGVAIFNSSGYGPHQILALIGLDLVPHSQLGGVKNIVIKKPPSCHRVA